WIPVTLPEQIRTFVPDLTLIGLGAATEASNWSNYHRIDRVEPEWTSIPYGVPLGNQGFRVLDESLRDAPVWVPGQLYITGHGLATGYLGDPELTAARFFDHPSDGQRLYQTGDLGRYLPGGEIEFLGREDDQIKLRGHRIELGEIDAALLSHPSVAAAAAVVAGDRHATRTLLAFAELARSASRAADDESGPSTARLVSAATRFADRQVSALSAEHVADHMDKLRHAALASMLSGLLECGLFAEPGHAHSAEEILHAARVHERHHWLIRRWLGLLTEAGWLTCEQQRWAYPRHEIVDAAAVDRAWQQVEDGVARGLCTDEFVRYHRTHVEQLRALLQHEQNPFELLFPQGKQDVAHAIYRDDAVARYNNHAVAALMNRIAAGHPEGTRLRILELGAGTGATSGVVIPVLDGHEVDYLFTDITAFFLAEARQQFSERPWVRFGLFDLDRDYRAQGYAPNSADIVLCAGMLNSTRARATRRPPPWRRRR
ncbi:MAG: AMP-binding protein, partial [Myxococcota bacterium]